MFIILNIKRLFTICISDAVKYSSIFVTQNFIGMKKVFLLIVIAASLISTGFAQTDAKSILENVSNKLKSYKGISANFTYTTKDKKNAAHGTKSGQILVKGQKYYLKQGTTEIFSDGSKNWNYNSADKEVTETDAADNSQGFTPAKFLSNFYDKDFTYNLISSAGNTYQIVLLPVDKRKNYKQVTVFIDKAKSLVTKAQVLDKADNTIEFALSNIKTDAAIADNKFVYDEKAHPGVEVISQ